MSRFLPYTLSSLLPEEATLWLDTSPIHGLALFLDGELVELQTLTHEEYGLVRVLLANFPYYAPLAALHAAKSGEPAERSEKRVRRALDQGTINALIRPVRNTLSRCRVKLELFGLDVKSIPETGYMLLPLRQEREQWTEEY